MSNINVGQLLNTANSTILRIKNGSSQFINLGGISINDKSLSPGINSGSVNSFNTSIQISITPIGYIMVLLNGLLRSLGDGVATLDCYFTDAGGAPAFTGNMFNSFAGSNDSNSSGALKSIDGTAWTWGLGTSGQLGDNSTVTKSSPASVVGAHSFTQFAGGTSDHIALKSDGSAWTWGVGTTGRLGDNTATSKSSPVSVVGAHNFALVQMSSNGYGLKSNNGTIWSWGNGVNGELGDNTTVSKSSPSSVAGAHSFTNFNTGTTGAALSYVAALKSSDGSIWTWGANNSGGLGDSTTVAKSSPTSVLGAHSFTSLSTGGHVTALKSDGSAWGWGLGTSGQLGQNTSAVSRSSPVSVAGAHSFISVSVGGTHTLTLKSDGSCWAWGSNSGKLGDNTTDNRSSPVSVVGAHSFISIIAGSSYSMGLKSDGSVWAWGTNGQGQLGDNTTDDKSSPVAIQGAPSGLGTPKSIANIEAGDTLIWNATNSGINLLTTDKIDLNYFY